MTTRDQHLAWCKQRALELLDGDPEQGITPNRGRALASMLSDLGKHDETAEHSARVLGQMMAVAGTPSVSEIRTYIEGIR